MALSGLSVVCGFSSADSNNKSKASTFGGGVWSELLLVSGKTSRPAESGDNPNPYFRIFPVVDGYVAVGPRADASKSQSTTRDDTRYPAPAFMPQDIPCQPGDYLAWVTV